MEFEKDNFDDLSWDTPEIPPENSLVVLHGKNVVLVRHHFAETGDVREIYNEYLDAKISDNSA